MLAHHCISSSPPSLLPALDVDRTPIFLSTRYALNSLSLKVATTLFVIVGARSLGGGVDDIWVVTGVNIIMVWVVAVILTIVCVTIVRGGGGDFSCVGNANLDVGWKYLLLSSCIMTSLVFNSACLLKMDVVDGGNMKRRLKVQSSVVSLPTNLQVSEKLNVSKSVRIGVLGASGYTGSEIVRLLANHPYFGITLMTADRKAGQSIASVFPHLITQGLPNMVAIQDADFSNVDAVFCCLPHGTTQDIVKALPSSLKVVDLSADFRLKHIPDYEEWYGQPHRATELQKEAVYGLTEILRQEIQNARLVANPGCYPTSIQLPLVPLLKGNLIQHSNIIIDAKSGVSGAGRGAKEANLYTEVAEGIHAYGVTRHRHVPEIEQGLSEVVRSKVTVSFTPHLMPMSRGMQSTIYVEMAPGVRVEDLYEHLNNFYEKEEFVKMLEQGVVPHTRNVRGSNYCFMNVFPDRIPGRAIIISVIDNLVKGASGQAVQNLNIMMGYPESTGLLYQPLFP